MKVSRVRFVLFLLAILLIVAAIFGLGRLTAGPSAGEKSAAFAADAARNDAEKARAGFEGILRANDDSEKARQEAVQWVGSVDYVTVTGSRVSAGTAEMDLAVINRADATDGFSHASSLVRVCARLSGRPGAQAIATKTNLRCPGNAPLQIPSLGTVNKIVAL